MTVHFSNDGELTDYYMRYDYESIEKNIGFYDYIELLPKGLILKFMKMMEQEVSHLLKLLKI